MNTEIDPSRNSGVIHAIMPLACRADQEPKATFINVNEIIKSYDLPVEPLQF